MAGHSAALRTNPSEGAYAYQPTKKSRPELNWKYVVQNEIVNVTNALRKNQRWSLPFEREKKSDLPASPPYNFCRENGTYGYANLDAVLEFTKGQGKAARGFAAAEDSSLLHGFSTLRARLTLVHALRDLDPLILLEPFLEVIRSPDTTGPMTGAALTSVEKFITYRVLDPNHPGLSVATAALTDAVVRCRFEATDAVADEAVLAKILGLLRVILISDIGQKSLSDRGICEMVEVAFGMIFQGRVNELLRKSAEQTLIALVQALFERLTVLVRAREHEDQLRAMEVPRSRTPEPLAHSARFAQAAGGRRPSVPMPILSGDGTDHAGAPSPSIQMFNPSESSNVTRDVNLISVAGSAGSSASHEEHGDSPRIAVSRNEHILSDGGIRAVRPEHGPARSALGAGTQLAQPSSANLGSAENEASEHKATSEETGNGSEIAAASMQPFGLPAILEMLRVLITLIDPKNHQHTDSMHRTIALGLLHAGLEVGGLSLGKLISWTLHADQASTGADEPSLNTILPAAPEARRSPSPILPLVEVSVGLPQLGRPSSIDGTLPTQLPGDADAEAESWQDGEDRIIMMFRDLVLNELCRHLFQLLQNSAMASSTAPSTTSIGILSLSLQCITTLLQTCRQQLKMQQEWFIEWVLERLDAGIVTWDIGGDWDQKDTAQGASPHRNAVPTSRGTPIVGEARALILESLAQLCQMPHFAAELYINYDCDLAQRSHLFEALVTFLAKHTFPDLTPGGPIASASHQIICFDSLLIMVQHMVARKSFTRELPLKSSGTSGSQKTSVPEPVSNLPDTLAPEALKFNKGRKRILAEGSALFNQEPREGIVFLQEHNFLPTPPDPGSLAEFLRGTPTINKTVLGEYLAKPRNVDILRAFVHALDFSDKRFDEALRVLLESFRLPGEAQQIQRIVEVFADAYYNAMQLRGNNDLANADAIFVLSYSGIILNTDLHSRNIRHKMTLDGFFRNVRGLNNGGDFAPEFLTQIYNNIKDNEIVLPEEHEGELSFNYHWKELMKRSETCGPLIKYEKNSCDKDMLVVAWSPILAALSYAFDNAEEELTLQKAIVGFHHCSTIAAYYEISELFDSIIVALSKMTGFLKESRRLPPEILNLDTKKERESKFVDPWCVEVGRNYRSQVAAALMFGLVDEFGTSLLSGWRWVIACVRNMYLHMLLPNSMITAEDFVRGSIVIPRVPELTKVTRSTPATSAKREAGLFSTLSNFLSLSSSSGDDWADYEATPEEIESQRKARHCVASCKIEVLLSDTRFLEEATLKFLIDSLAQASFAQQERGPTEFESATKAEPTEEKPLSEQPAQPLKFDVAAVFLLELLVAINIHNRDRISVTWPRTLQHITTILQTSAAQNIVLIERAVVSLLQLILRVGHKDDIVSQIVSALSLVLTVPQDIFNAIAEQTMSGLLAIFKSDLTIVSRDLHWDVIFNLVARAGPHPEASRTSFEIACILISDKPADSVVNGENFGECVDLLISYAAAARLVPAGMGNASPSVRSASSPLNPGLLAAGSSPGSPVLGSRDNLAARSSANQGAVDQALRALDKLFRLHYAIPGLMEKSDMKIKRGFFEFWLPVLSGLSQQAYHPAREVRQYALAHLQRALLSSELEQGCQGQSSPEIWADCFENVLFPMLDELLRPEMTRLDPMGMDETRMRAAALLCKIFLQYFPHIHEWEDLPQLWGKILELMRKYMQAGGSDYLREGVQESLKNMLLVMSTQGIFQPPSEQQTMTYIKPNLWGPTWEYVDTFLPTLRSELFPTPTTTQQPAGQTSNGIAEPVETQTIEPPRPSLEKPLPVKEVPVEGGSVIMQDDT